MFYGDEEKNKEYLSTLNYIIKKENSTHYLWHSMLSTWDKMRDPLGMIHEHKYFYFYAVCNKNTKKNIYRHTTKIMRLMVYYILFIHS
jgi:hypothetical protein